MKIKYVTNVRIPTSRAQGYAIMKMCSEFAKADVETELFVPGRINNESNQDSFDFYKIERNFRIKRIPSFDFLGKTLKFGRIFYWIDILSFFVMAKFCINIKDGDILYTRDFLTALFLGSNKNLFLELHDIPDSKFLFRIAIKKPKKFFVLNKYLKTELMQMGVAENKIYISPSGVEISEFDIPVNKEEARIKVNLPLDKKIVLYSGQFYPWKGVNILAETAKLLPETAFIFVGGTDPELAKFRNDYGNIKNIIIRPFQERHIIPFYLKAADVLALPNSSQEQISARYTSPLKMFEYMAAKRPIVASNLPSIKEILNSNNCVLAEPDNPKFFATAIKKILENQGLTQDLAENAFREAERYSWEKRAEKIINLMQ